MTDETRYEDPPLDGSMSPYAFLSYSRKDSAFVARLGDDLKAAGVSVWLDTRDIPVGERWDRAIERALQDCRILIVVLSPDSAQSDNVMDEVSQAIDAGLRVIPVLARQCKVPLRLARLQRIEFEASYEDGLARLLQELPTTTGAPPTPRPSPPPAPAPQARKAPTHWVTSVSLAAAGIALSAWALASRPTSPPDPVSAEPAGAVVPPEPTAVVATEGQAPPPMAPRSLTAAPEPSPAIPATAPALTAPVPQAAPLPTTPESPEAAILADLRATPDGKAAAWAAADPQRASQLVSAIARSWPDERTQGAATSARARLVTDMNEHLADGRRLIGVLAAEGQLVRFVGSSKYGQGADFTVALRLPLADAMPSHVKRPTSAGDCGELADVLDILWRPPIPEQNPWIREACDACLGLTGVAAGKCSEIP